MSLGKAHYFIYVSHMLKPTLQNQSLLNCRLLWPLPGYLHLTNSTSIKKMKSILTLVLWLDPQQL
jgi:hypothetical protein